MSTKICDWMGASAGVTSGCERVSSSYSLGAKLCIHLGSDTSIFGREMVSFFLGEGWVRQLCKAAVGSWVLEDKLVQWNPSLYSLFLHRGCENEDQESIWSARTVLHFCLDARSLLGHEG